MQPITTEFKSHLSSDWKNKYEKLLFDEHLEKICNNINKLLFDHLPLTHIPYFVDEIKPNQELIIEELKEKYATYRNKKDAKIIWANVIQNLAFNNVLILLGQRLTSASIQDEIAIPPVKSLLLESCKSKHNKSITKIVRAWEKHVGRSEDDFWGEIKGSPKEKEQFVDVLVAKIIVNKTWWNVFYHYKHELVYEIRVESGHGIRWKLNNLSVVGFLEPFINEK